eukprot:jgi/Mesen1/2047/ME000149S01036
MADDRDSTATKSRSPSSHDLSAKAEGGDGGAKDGQFPTGVVVKTLCVLGGFYLVRKLTKIATRKDHARIVAQSLSGEKFSAEQAARDPMTFFNLRLMTCPAAELADGSRVLYYEQAFFSTPDKPYRQRFYKVKPCAKEMKCDVEVSSYAVRDTEEYKTYCDRPKNQRPQPEEVAGDIGEHLTTVYMSKCERGKKCLYEGSTPPGGYPNSWNGATRCTSELTILKNGEIQSWDRAYDDEGNQVWGVKQGPYEFKPRNASTPFSPAVVVDTISRQVDR